MLDRCVIDFGYDPTDRLMWVELDSHPDPAWFQLLAGALDDEVHRLPRVAAEGSRLYLSVNGLLEADGLSLLTSYVDSANILAHGVLHGTDADGFSTGDEPG